MYGSTTPKEDINPLAGQHPMKGSISKSKMCRDYILN